MNKVFKVIYNHSLRVWVAVSELAKGYVKSSSSSTKKQKNKKKGLLNLTSGSLLTAATILGTSSIAYAWTPNTQGGNNDYIWSGAGIAIGEGPNNEGSTALNKNAEVRGRHGIAIGGDSRANSTNSVAIGYGSRAESVHYGSETQKLTIGNYTSNITYAGAPNASTPVFSIGNSTSPRQLQYVAAGRVSENSTDAVNGSQLFAAIEALKDQNGLSGVMFNLTTSKSGTGNVTNNTTHGVEKGQLVTIDAGDNINITQAGGKVTIATSATPNFTSVNTGGLTVRPNSVVNFGGNVLANVGTPTNNTDAANKKYVDDRTFGLTTQNGNVSSKLDKSIGVEGGNTNINTSVVDGKVKINLNNTLDLGTSGSVKVGDSTLNNAGLTIAGGPSVTKKDGINAGNKKITNVSNGTNATDAVNFSQLNATNQNVTNLTTEVAKGWNINTSNSSGGNVSGNSLTNIKMGDTVFIDAGQNINITQSGQKISIATSSTPIFETVTANSSFKVGRTNVTNGAVSGIDDNLPSILNYEYRLPGQEGFPKANVNVTNAANVNDVLNAGWNLRSNDKNVDFVKTYDTVDLSDGDGTKVNFERNSSANSSVIKVNVQYDNSTIVKNANGKLAVNTSNIIKGDNTTTQITNNTIAVKTGNVSVNPNGTAVANTTNGSIATVTDVASAINDSYHTVNTVKNNNQVIAGANATGTQVKAGSTITYGAGKNLEIAQNGNNITYGLSKDIDVTNVTATNVKTGNTTLNDAGLTIANGPSVTKDGINAGDKKITNVLDGTDPLDAVNLSQLNASKSVVEAGNNIKVTPNPTANGTVYTVEANTGSATFTNGNASTPDGSALATTGDLVNVTNNASQYLTDKGLNFAGNKGGNIHKNLGETLTIKGTLADGKDASSENLRVDSNGNELVVQMAKDLANLTSVTTTGDNGTTKVSGDGIVIDPKVAGKDNVSLTTNGLNNGNNKIVNVANGTDPLDAVNFSQLNATNQNVTNLNNEIAKGWNINTSSSTGGNVTGNTATNIKMGDTVVVDAGKNINITQTGQKISIATSSTPTFDSVDTGNLTVRANGSVNFNNVTLKNVGAPTQDGDAANKKYVDDRTFGLTTQNGNVSSKLDKSIGVEGGNTNINTSVADGKVKINLNNTLNLGTSGSVTVGDSTLNNAGLTIAGGPSVTKDGINAGDKKITNVLDGTDPLDAVNLSQLNASKSVVEAGNNIKVTPTPSANGTVYTVEANTGSATFTNGNASTPDGSALATTGDLVNVTNNASQYLTDKGLNFAGNKGGNIHKNLGETLTIKGTLADGKDASSENLRVDSNGNELVVQMAKDLANLTSVTTTGDNGTTKVDGDGITISPTAPGEGKGNVSLTGNG
ncbi:trimeric autotransporter adhesin, partial [Mesocricetibacter intestinalis]